MPITGVSDSFSTPAADSAADPVGEPVTAEPLDSPEPEATTVVDEPGVAGRPVEEPVEEPVEVEPVVAADPPSVPVQPAIIDPATANTHTVRRICGRITPRPSPVADPAERAAARHANDKGK